MSSCIKKEGIDKSKHKQNERKNGSFGVKFLFDMCDLMCVIHLGTLSLFSKSTCVKGSKFRIGK